MTIPIYLNIYDLHNSNSYLHGIGAGFYHTGVEINDQEYSFSNEGVSKTHPQLAAFGQLRDKLLVGQFDGRMSDVNAILTELRSNEFRSGLYDVARKNCNHFSDAFIFKLLGIHIPTWINRMADIGAATGIGTGTGGSASASNSGSVLGGLAAPGKVKDPVMPVPEVRNDVQSSSKGFVDGNDRESGGSLISSIFSWLSAPAAATTSSSSSSSTTPANERSSTTRSQPNSNKKKELTEKQKELLAKMKSSNK